MDDEKKELTHIDLFSGIGGFTLAAEWAGFRTVVFCEKEKFCQGVLKKRFGAVIADSKHLRKLQSERGKQNQWGRTSDFPILIPEIRDFDGTKYRGAALLTGGFPCQPFSVAGQQRGKEDDRWLWPEMLRVIGEAKPRWILAENVPGIFRMALDTVLTDLEGEGYTIGTFIIPACGLNAPHRRNRVWIVANSTNDGGQELCGNMEKTKRQKSQAGHQPSNGSLNSNSDAQNTIGTRAGNQDRKINDQEGRISQDRREGIRQKDRTISSGGSTSTNKNACHSPSNRYQGRCEETRGKEREGEQGGMRESERANSNVTDSESSKCKLSRQTWKGRKGFTDNYWQENWYEIATKFCRVDDGVSDRIHRLKALGNAIVPQIAFEIIKNIAWIERNIS